MSVKLMARVWDSEQPTNTHKLVLLCFADHANDEGICWPSIARIAQRSQMSRRQVQRIVSDLKETGLLEVVQEATRNLPPTYQVRGDKLTPLPDLGVTPTSQRGDILTPGGVTNQTERGDTHVTLTVTKEPLLRNHHESINYFQERYERLKS